MIGTMDVCSELYAKGVESAEVETFELEIGSHQRVIIDKLYGPMVFAELRITPDTATCQWVIERKRIDSCEWVEVARIEGQFAHEFDEGHPEHKPAFPD